MKTELLYSKKVKAIDIDQDEAAKIRREIECARKLIAAVIPALQETDRLLRNAHVYVAEVESKAFWAPDIEIGEKIYEN